jgi:recombinational DNA repair protein RecR
MTKDELKKEAEEEADKVIIGSGMDRTSVIHLKYLLVTMYIQGATKVTKELESQIEKMKNCKNCKKLKKEKDGLLVCTVGSFYTNTFGENCDKWEIKEK